MATSVAPSIIRNSFDNNPSMSESSLSPTFSRITSCSIDAGVFWAFASAFNGIVLSYSLHYENSFHSAIKDFSPFRTFWRRLHQLVPSAFLSVYAVPPTLIPRNLPQNCEALCLLPKNITIQNEPLIGYTVASHPATIIWKPSLKSSQLALKNYSQSIPWQQTFCVPILKLKQSSRDRFKNCEFVPILPPFSMLRPSQNRQPGKNILSKFQPQWSSIPPYTGIITSHIVQTFLIDASLNDIEKEIFENYLEPQEARTAILTS